MKEELALFLHYNGFKNVREAIGAEHRAGSGSNLKQLPPHLLPPSQNQAAAVEQQTKSSEQEKLLGMAASI